MFCLRSGGRCTYREWLGLPGLWLQLQRWCHVVLQLDVTTPAPAPRWDTVRLDSPIQLLQPTQVLRLPARIAGSLSQRCGTTGCIGTEDGVSRRGRKAHCNITEQGECWIGAPAWAASEESTRHTALAALVLKIIFSSPAARKTTERQAPRGAKHLCARPPSSARCHPLTALVRSSSIELVYLSYTGVERQPTERGKVQQMGPMSSCLDIEAL